MKKLLLTAAFIALGASSAMAFGPGPDDADPPGALFSSKPNGTDHVPRAVREMNSAPVSMRWHRLHTAPVSMRWHRRHTPGAETGSASDRASAPAR